MTQVRSEDTLYVITMVHSFNGHLHEDSCWGWIRQGKDSGKVAVITIDGKNLSFMSGGIAKLRYIPVNDALVDSVLKKKADYGLKDGMAFENCYSLALWLHVKGRSDMAKRLFQRRDKTYIPIAAVQSYFGFLNYNSMLQAFSDRNYNEAIYFGSHLSSDVFKGYQYQGDIILLTQQLRGRPQDFKSLCLPHPPVWDSMKRKLSRTEQIKYLADRLKLLNCIQPGQPAGISYSMLQYSVPVSESSKLGFSYWEYNEAYTVVNPYTELIQMELTMEETELLLPYMLDGSYIPTYTYFRSYRPTRTVHKLSWVVNDLLFRITDKHFLEDKHFDSLSKEEKVQAVDEIKAWCRTNRSTSQETYTRKLIFGTDKWTEFVGALERAHEKKYDFVLEAITRRFADFKIPYNYQGTMARMMYEWGNAAYGKTVMDWSLNNDDPEVQLWSGLFLLRYDPDQHDYALTQLERLLQLSDGGSYYPDAVSPLLADRTKRAKKLAEGILDKENFQNQIFWDHNIDIVKELLFMKSDYAADILIRKLQLALQYVRKAPAQKNMLTLEEAWVWAVDKLRGRTWGYGLEWNTEAKQNYIKELAAWFGLNYQRYRAGASSELRLTLSGAAIPVQQLDAPR